MSQFVIGLSGGIGSGKTTVSDLFADLGIVIADSDVVARAIVAPGQPAHAAIQQHFGDSILLSDGHLDRSKLREIVFSNMEERRWLESQTHGRIMKALEEVITQATSAYSILVLSAGSGRSPLIDRMLVVDVPEDVQIIRVMERDSNSIKQVKAIMNSQPTRKERLNLADDTIMNDGSIEELKRIVELLHATYIDKAGKAS